MNVRKWSTRVALVLVTVLALAGCDWTMFRANPAHTGFVPGETAIGVANVAGLQQTSSYSGTKPVIAAGLLYTIEPSTNTLIVQDAKTHDVRWTAPVAGNIAVVGGTAFVAGAGAGEAKLFAFDAAGVNGCAGTPATCQPLWTADLATPYSVGEPVVSNGMVIVNGRRFGTDEVPSADVMAAFDAAGQQSCSGSPKVCLPLWGATTPMSAFETPSITPAVAGGRVYLLGGDNRIYVYDVTGQQGCGGSPRSCTPLWTTDSAVGCDTSSGCVTSTPVIAGNVLYVQGFGTVGGLFAYDATATTGCSGVPIVCSPIWRAAGRGSAPPVVANGQVLTNGFLVANGTSVTGSSRVRSFDAKGVAGCSGVPKVCVPQWTSAAEVERAGNLVVANGVVYTISNHSDCDEPLICFNYPRLIAFDAAGSTGCGGTPKLCTTLVDLPGEAGFNTFVDVSALANGVLYATDDPADFTAPHSVFEFTVPPG